MISPADAKHQHMKRCELSGEQKGEKRKIRSYSQHGMKKDTSNANEQISKRFSNSQHQKT